MSTTKLTKISPKMPYETQYVRVNGARMAYVAAGAGDPILFLHGNPTSKYLWRNIMPHLEKQGRVIAPDLIGMGESDKPDIGYRYHDHYEYLSGFINRLGLNNITLVVHDWGSGLGFNFAAQNPERIKALVFMEAVVRPLKWEAFPADYKIAFKLIRTPGIGWFMVQIMNGFIKQLLPQSIVRKLSTQEQAMYAKPYPTVASRKPLRQWPLEVPISGTPSDVHTIVRNYSQWLQQTEIPKLFFYATPGAIIDRQVADWVKQSFSNLTSFDLGEGIHFVQEDNPHFIGEMLSQWYAQLEIGKETTATKYKEG